MTAFFYKRAVLFFMRIFDFIGIICYNISVVIITNLRDDLIWHNYFSFEFKTVLLM